MENNQTNFFKGPGGRFLITVINAFVIWGLMIVFIYSNVYPIVLIIVGVCAFFGWRVLSSIQPTMFVWMSLAGWLVYFTVKFVLSVLIGFFIAPFSIGKTVGQSIHDSIR